MSRNSTKHITPKATRRVRSLRTKAVIDNSDTPIPSAPIIMGRSRVGKNKRDDGRKLVGHINMLTGKFTPTNPPWQKLAAKRAPYAWRAFRREFHRQHPAGSAVYSYEWEWFLRGWKARVSRGMTTQHKQCDALTRKGGVCRKPAEHYTGIFGFLCDTHLKQYPQDLRWRKRAKSQ